MLPPIRRSPLDDITSPDRREEVASGRWQTVADSTADDPRATAFRYRFVDGAFRLERYPSGEMLGIFGSYTAVRSAIFKALAKPDGL